ncbi:MAG: hypothetical protein ACETV0_04860 [Nitrososphaeria archaeon]
MPQVCPKCLSIQVDLDWRTYLGGFSVRRYVCSECGYEGPVILEVSHGELKRIREDKMKEVGKEGQEGKEPPEDDRRETT